MDRKKPEMPPKRLSSEASNAVIDNLGGTNAVAKLCGIRPASVSDWRGGGIPRPWVLFLRERYRTLPGMKKSEILDF